MVKLENYLYTIGFIVLLLLTSCNNNDDIVSPDNTEYITYSWFNESISKAGNDISLLENMQNSIDSLISTMPADVRFKQVKKSENDSENISEELKQIDIFNKAFENAHKFYKPENFKEDTSKIIHFTYNIGLKKNNNLIKIAEFSYIRALPYLNNSVWKNENNPSEYIEFYDYNDVKLSYKGKTINTTYKQMITVMFTMPDSSNILLKFISGKRAYIEDPVSKEKTYFVKE